MGNHKEITSAMTIGTELEGKEFKYRIVRILGQGSLGITYLVELVGKTGQSTQIYMALKEFFLRDFNGRDGLTVTCSSESGLFNDYRKNFIHEAENLSKIRHDNIVNVVECFEANNTVYFIMNYIAGESLDQLISKYGSLSEPQALEITKQLCAALGHLHSEGLLHLDVKPGNILMISERVPMLIDFGLSKHINKNGEPETSTRIGTGTPGFAPLEQTSLPNKKRLTPMIDIYSLGATLFKMLTGNRPANAAELLNQGFPANLLREKGVSPATIAIIEKAMAPSMKDRYTSMYDIEKDINSILGITEPPAKKEPDYTPSPALVNETPAEREEIPVLMAEVNEMPSQAEILAAEPGSPENTYSDRQEEEKKKKMPVVVYMLCALGIIIICLIAYFALIGKGGDPKTSANDSDSVQTESVATSPDTTSAPAALVPAQDSTAIPATKISKPIKKREKVRPAAEPVKESNAQIPQRQNQSDNNMKNPVSPAAQPSESQQQTRNNLKNQPSETD